MKDIYQEEGIWKIHCWEDAVNELNVGGRGLSKEICIGPAGGPDRLTKKKAQRIAWENFLSRLRQDKPAAQSDMTVARFVETVFVPMHVQAKRLSSRAYYQAMLKYVLPPDEVDRIFHVDRERPKANLRVIPEWPYLVDLQLRDCGPEHIERLISAAIARGYSAQTVMHIRDVVRTVFSHAKKSRLYQHDNPAKMAILPESPHRSPHLLTLTQAKEILRAMRYPEKEMTLITMLTSMNVGEICGLQWKYVNLTGAWSNITGEPIPPISIAVRKRWHRGELDTVSGARARNLPIPEVLLPMLIKLSGRGRCTEPDDFVLVSKAGTPINAINITARRLRSIGNELQIPWLNWHVFRRGNFALEAELGAQFHFHLASTLRSEPPREIATHERLSRSA